jgi:uncharacterized protein
LTHNFQLILRFIAGEEAAAMKRIGLLSDTHLDFCDISRLKKIIPVFENVDLILHAGDITHESVLECCKTIAPVHAVKGNMDYHSSVIDLPAKKILMLENWKIGLIHGWGSPEGLMKRVFQAFEGDSPSVIVYGHSHQAAIDTWRNCLMINPGSPFDRRFAPYRSLAVLTLDSGGASAEIIRLDPRGRTI